mmetsp:Transcript_25722/g.69802  ORF Transcript_25722/g.69802 Transcript_25722/m.69802 type:complete len:458 (+) Transcript_25722:461-1834(+)
MLWCLVLAPFPVGLLYCTLVSLPCLLVHGRSRRPQGAVSIAALTFILIRPSLTADGPLLYLHTSSIQPICCLPLMYTSARAWSVFVPTWLTTALTACQSSFASLLCHTRTYNNTSTLGPITSAVAVWRSVHLAIALCMACYAFPGPLLPCRFPLLFLLLHNLCRADHLLAGIAHANQCGPVAFFCFLHSKVITAWNSSRGNRMLLDSSHAGVQAHQRLVIDALHTLCAAALLCCSLQHLVVALIVQNLIHALGDEGLLKHSICHRCLRVLTNGPACGDFHEPVQCCIQGVLSNQGVHRKLEQLSHRQHSNAFGPEVVVDVLAVLSQEIQRLWVVQVYRLRHVNDPQLPLMVQDVVLAEVRMHQAASLIQGADGHHHLCVSLAQACRGQVSVTKPRRRHTILSNEFHDQHVHAQLNGGRHVQACGLEPCQVAQLLLSPHLDHLARVAAAVACLEPVVT